MNARGKATAFPVNLFLDEQHCGWVQGKRQLRDVRIVVILEKRKLHAVTFVRHLNDHRHRGGELSDRRGNSLIVRSTPVGYGRHPHLDVEIARELRSEEHTSELQSLTNLVCRLLLEKKK